VEIDEQYTQLIRETEEILTQLENDDFMIFKPEVDRKSDDRKHQDHLQPLLPPTLLPGGRKKIRKCAAMRRASREVPDAVTSSESEVDFLPANNWMAGRKSDWRRMRTASSHQHRPHRITPQQQQQQQHPSRLHPAVHPHSRFSVLDEWRHDVDDGDIDDDDERRPPSPAPMDPQCHRPNFRRKEIGTMEQQQHPDYWPEANHAHSSWRNAPPDAYAGYAPRRKSEWNGAGSSSSEAAPTSAFYHYRKEAQVRRPEVRKPEVMDETLRKTLMEQQRLESQIAFLRRQLIKNVADVTKYVDDMAYVDVDDDRWGTSTDSSSYDTRRRHHRRRRYVAKPPHRPLRPA